MNKKLPYDICRCNNASCSDSDVCARFTNFRDGHMRPVGGSPVTRFGQLSRLDGDKYLCTVFILDEVGEYHEEYP